MGHSREFANHAFQNSKRQKWHAALEFVALLQLTFMQNRRDAHKCIGKWRSNRCWSVILLDNFYRHCGISRMVYFWTPNKAYERTQGKEFSITWDSRHKESYTSWYRSVLNFPHCSELLASNIQNFRANPSVLLNELDCLSKFRVKLSACKVF